MLGWFKKKGGGDEGQVGEDVVEEVRDPDGPVIAAVLLREAGDLDLDWVGEMLKGAELGNEVTDCSVTDGTLTANCGDALVAVSVMPVGYPWSDLEGPCETARLWPEGTNAASVRAGKSHVLVIVMRGGGGDVARRLLCSNVAVIVAKAAGEGTLGVFWPEGSVVNHPKLFIEMVKVATEERPPLLAWVDFRVFVNEDGTSGMFTTGLRGLGLMEMEMPRMKVKPPELWEWGMDLAAYQLDKGPVLLDGQTIGRTPTEKFKIKHTKSSFGGKGKVVRIG